LINYLKIGVINKFIKFVKNVIMDLQTRKLNTIEYLLNLKDEVLFNKIESIIIESQNENKRELKPLSQEQLINRAKQANEDYLAGNFKTQDQLETESENW